MMPLSDLPVFVLAAFAILLIGLLKLVAMLLKSPSGKGRIGEKMTSTFILGSLNPSIYQVFDDLYVPRSDRSGVTQVDHVVISQYGIFVIETKNMSGWIFGRERDRWWTQQIYRQKNRFQNPLRQNYAHLKALQVYLKLPLRTFRSVVYFVGEAEFKTAMPENVLRGGLRNFIMKHQEPELSHAEIDRVAALLRNLKDVSSDPSIRAQHVQALKKRNRPSNQQSA